MAGEKTWLEKWPPSSGGETAGRSNPGHTAQWNYKRQSDGGTEERKRHCINQQDQLVGNQSDLLGETSGKNMAIQITLGGLFRCLRKLVSIGFTLLFCDILLRVSFVLLFFMLLPFFIIYDHVVPSTILFIKSIRPILDAFFGRLLPSVFAFVLSLIPPVIIFFFTKHILVPISIKVFQLTW